MHPAAPDIIAPRGLERGLVGTIVVSALLHAAAIGLMIVVPGSFPSAPPRIQSYTVDLVAPNVIGGTNLIAGGGPRKPAPAKVEPPQVAPAAESLPPAPVVAAEPAPPQAAPGAPPPKAAEPSKPQEPAAPPPPVAAAPPKPAPPPPKPVEAKPPAPPRPAAEPVKAKPPAEPKPAVKADARKPPPPVEKSAPAKPVAQKPAPPPAPAKAAAKPAPKPEAKSEPKSEPKAETKPEPKRETKADAKPPETKPKPDGKAGPQETGAKSAASKSADPAQDRDRAISAAVQKRAAQAGPGDAASKALDQRIAAAVQRRADQVEKGGSGAPGPGGPISAGPGSGVGGTPTDMQYVLYEGRMRERIRNAWAWTGADRTLTVVIQFSVAPDGQILNVRTLKSSGDPSYDASAERAVRAANPLEPVPEKYRDAFATVELTFRASDLES